MDPLPSAADLARRKALHERLHLTATLRQARDSASRGALEEAQHRLMSVPPSCFKGQRPVLPLHAPILYFLAQAALDTVLATRNPVIRHWGTRPYGVARREVQRFTASLQVRDADWIQDAVSRLLLVVSLIESAELQLGLLRDILRALPDDLPAVRQPVREAIAANPGIGYGVGEKPAHEATLADARPYADVSVILENDEGDFVYLTTPVALVRCDNATLLRLAWDLDRWLHRAPVSHPGQVYFGRLLVGRRVGPGDPCGGVVTNELRVHPDLERHGLRSAIERILLGKQATLQG